VTRRVASVLRDADVCTQKQKAAAKRVAESTKRREEAERTLRLAEAASRLAGDAFDPVAAARDAAASMSRRTTPSRTSLERRSDEASAAESSLESSPESDAPPKKKTAAIPLSPVAPAARSKVRSWTPERGREEARAEANALADMFRAATLG
jgi:hypothetical protein